MKSSAEKVAFQEIADYKSNIIYPKTFNSTDIQPEPSQIGTIPSHKEVTNENTYEYIIREIINKDFLVQEQLKFYLAGFSTGHNMGYIAAMKDFTSETGEMNKMADHSEYGERLKKVETQISYIETGITEIKNNTKDLAVMQKDINDIKEKFTWKQRLWSSMITGLTITVFGGLLLALAKYVFRI